ncbi:MAG: response regulator [Phycisphaerae bacterium]|nr:response regulator [Phycisphaerae bacterium]
MTNRSILVCDADESILDLLGDVFTDDGAIVTSAQGGQACLDLLRGGNFELIFQALVMPDVDGWDVLSYLRSRRTDLLRRLVLMTGYTYDTFTIRRLERLGLPALFKPFDLDELKTMAYRTLQAVETSKPRRIAA